MAAQNYCAILYIFSFHFTERSRTQSYELSPIFNSGLQNEIRKWPEQDSNIPSTNMLKIT